MLKNMLRTIAAISLVASVASCDLDVPDLNNPGLDSLSEHPTRSGILAAATGLIIGNRIGFSTENGYVAHLGILGREMYNFDPADPRYVDEMLKSSFDPGATAFGGNFWAAPYVNIRSAFTVLHAVDAVVGMPDTEKEAARGLAKTIQALDFLVIINAHDTNGAPILVDRPISDLAPIASKAEVFAHIKSLLDEAKGHLEKAGGTFPFALSTGYAGFDTPATFLKFNRAIKARVDVYTGDFNAALTDLAASFISNDPANPALDVGVYHSYGTGSGDSRNGLINKNFFAHPSVVTDADKKADGTTLDDRVTRKIDTIAMPAKYKDLTSNLVFKIYKSPTDRVPIIRNEELILLRAEANIGLNNLVAAADDINFIRVNSGGLAPRLDLTTAAIALTELLKQKRYSLMFEGGHRWIDARRYGLLNTLPLDRPGDVVHDRFPIPTSESDAR